MARELVWTGFTTLDGRVDPPGSETEVHPGGGRVFATDFVPEACSLSGAIFIHGSAELGRRLGDADLIDRYHLLVVPFLLGSGKGASSERAHDRRALRLRATDSCADGVVELVDDVVR